MIDISNLIYKKPKKGDIVILSNDSMKHPKDFGASGLVFQGYPELVLNKEYEVIGVDFSDIPKESRIFNKTTLNKVKYAYSKVIISLGGGKIASIPLEYFKQKEN